jgi:hypothetical protein
MHVIREIILYLCQRGLLSGPDLRYLRQHGFDLEDELAETDPQELADADERRRYADAFFNTPELLAEDAIDAIERRLDRPVSRRSGSGGGRRPRAELTAAAISGRILAHWPQWEAHLAALRALAAQLAPVPDLPAAAQALRDARAGDLDLAIASLVRSGKPSIDAIWKALSFNGYGQGIAPAGATGAAVRAYQLVARGRPHREIGRYAAALRHAGLARLSDLVGAQRAVLRAFGRCLGRDPVLFDRRLFGARCDAVCYWSLTIALSAIVPVHRGSMPFRVHGPRRPMPEGEQEAQAWGCAAAMDGHAVALLLSAPIVLRCPVAWDATYFP